MHLLLSGFGFSVCSACPSRVKCGPWRLSGGAASAMCLRTLSSSGSVERESLLLLLLLPTRDQRGNGTRGSTDLDDSLGIGPSLRAMWIRRKERSCTRFPSGSGASAAGRNENLDQPAMRHQSRQSSNQHSPQAGPSQRAARNTARRRTRPGAAHVDRRARRRARTTDGRGEANLHGRYISVGSVCRLCVFPPRPDMNTIPNRTGKASEDVLCAPLPICHRLESCVGTSQKAKQRDNAVHNASAAQARHCHRRCARR